MYECPVLNHTFERGSSPQEVITVATKYLNDPRLSKKQQYYLNLIIQEIIYVPSLSFDFRKLKKADRKIEEISKKFFDS